MPRKNAFNYINYALTGTEHGGPFNVVAEKRPKAYRDGNFWDHDTAYRRIGNKAYYRFGNADQTLLNKLRWKHPGDIGAKSYFTSKKHVAPSLSQPIMPGLRGSRSRFNRRPSTALVPYGSATRAQYVQRGRTSRASRFSSARTRTGRSPGRRPKVDSFAVTRYRGKRIGRKRFLKHYSRRYKKRPGNELTAKRLCSLLCPRVSWKMYGTDLAAVTSLAGRQNVSDGNEFSTLFSLARLRSIYGKLYQDVSQGNVSGTNDAETTHLAGGTVATEGDADFLPDLACKGWKRVLEVFNPVNGVCFVDFYEYVARVDGDELPSTFFVTACASKAAVGNPGNYGLLVPPLNTTNPTVDQTFAITDPNTEPWGKELRARWRKVKKTTYKIEPTACIHHTISVPGFNVPQRRLWDPENDAIYLKDITMIVMMRIRGERAYDNTAGNQRMSYAPGSTTVKFTDYTHWQIRPRGHTYYKFATNDVPGFALAFNTANSVPIAAIPRIGIPAYAVVNTDHDVTVNNET